MPPKDPMHELPFLPYGKQHITGEDLKAVNEALRSDWLTQGPAVPAFEARLCRETQAPYAVACSSGTAALHLSMLALGVGPGDVVLTSPITFLASANCARYVGADVKFADIDPRTGLMDPEAVAGVLAEDKGHRIKAIIPVHFAGQPAALPIIKALAEKHGAFVVDDACHAIGARYLDGDRWVRIGNGQHTDTTIFSFHPVKHVTTGEGGALAMSRAELAERAARLRSHGIARAGFLETDLALAPDGSPNPWYYEQQELGFNYRLTDLQASLGVSQMDRLEHSLLQRNRLAAWYREKLARTFPEGGVTPLHVREDVFHAYHLFVVQIEFDQFDLSRAHVMTALKARNIGTQVHYIPVHLQPYYRRHSGTGPGDFPKAEAYYRKALSLPMYPELGEADVERVVRELHSILGGRA